VIGWLAWVGSALVLVSIVFDDRRSLRLVNLLAAVAVLTAALVVGSLSMVVLNVALVALAVRRMLPARADQRHPAFHRAA